MRWWDQQFHKIGKDCCLLKKLVVFNRFSQGSTVYSLGLSLISVVAQVISSLPHSGHQIKDFCFKFCCQILVYTYCTNLKQLQLEELCKFWFSVKLAFSVKIFVTTNNSSSLIMTSTMVVKVIF